MVHLDDCMMKSDRIHLVSEHEAWLALMDA